MKTILFDLQESDTIMFSLSLPIGWFDEDLKYNQEGISTLVSSSIFKTQ